MQHRGHAAAWGASGHDEEEQVAEAGLEKWPVQELQTHAQTGMWPDQAGGHRPGGSGALGRGVVRAEETTGGSNGVAWQASGRSCPPHTAQGTATPAVLRGSCVDSACTAHQPCSLACTPAFLAPPFRGHLVRPRLKHCPRLRRVTPSPARLRKVEGSSWRPEDSPCCSSSDPSFYTLPAITGTEQSLTVTFSVAPCPNCPPTCGSQPDKARGQ